MMMVVGVKESIKVCKSRADSVQKPESPSHRSRYFFLLNSHHDTGVGLVLPVYDDEWTCPLISIDGLIHLCSFSVPEARDLRAGSNFDHCPSFSRSLFCIHHLYVLCCILSAKFRSSILSFKLLYLAVCIWTVYWHWMTLHGEIGYLLCQLGFANFFIGIKVHLIEIFILEIFLSYT